MACGRKPELAAEVGVGEAGGRMRPGCTPSVWNEPGMEK